MISQIIPRVTFNSRKVTICAVLIVLTMLIILKILQLSKNCQKLREKDEFRVSGRIFERPVVGNRAVIVDFKEFSFNFYQFSKEQAAMTQKIPGREAELSGKISKITFRSLLSSEISKEKPKDSVLNRPTYYNSIDAQNFSTQTRGVIPVYYCQIDLIGQSLVLKNGKGDSGNRLVSAFFLKITRLQERIVKIFSSRLSEPHGSLALGMLFGVNPQMSPEFRDQLVATGLLHVVAASGYNINLISAVVQSFLRRFLRRGPAFFFSGVSIVVYVVLAGMSPSVMRAGIMGVLSLWATSSGKLYRVKWALLLTTLGMLWWSPSLIFSASFQLSVAATFGIIFILPRITPHWLQNNESKPDLLISNTIRFFAESFLTTTAASLMTIPIILISFGRVSVISFLANTVLVGLVPWIMTLATIYLIVAVCVPPLAVLAVLPLWSVTQIFIIGIEKLAAVPFAQLEFHNVSEWWMVVWLVGIGLFMKLRPLNDEQLTKGTDE